MFITNDHLQRLRKEFIESKSLTVLNEAFVQRTTTPRSDEITIFLSHKHSDKKLVEDVIAMLNYIGVKVYVDWLDDEMPTSTSGVTAQKIKNKIITNKKFMLLATTSAIASKWCNWELGFGDAKKYPKDIAIIPIADTTNSWPGNEYLQIYPYVTTDYNYLFTGYFVEFQGRKVRLEDWLKS